MSDWMNDWLTEGGIDGEVVTLTNVSFMTDPEYREGQQPFLSIDLVPENPDLTPFEGQRFGIGAGWEITDDDGTSITREDGRRAQYNTGSKAGRLLKSLLEDDGFTQALAAKHKAGEQVTPFDAAFYEGIKGVVHSNEDSFEADGETITFRFYTLTDVEGYAGSNGSGKKATKAAADKPAKKAAAKKSAAKKAVAKNNDADLEAQVRAHCKATELDTHDDWMMAVYEEIPDVTEDEAVQALIDDPDAIWAEIWG